MRWTASIWDFWRGVPKVKGTLRVDTGVLQGFGFRVQVCEFRMQVRIRIDREMER